MSVVTTEPDKAGLDIRTLRELARSSVSERERREAEWANWTSAQKLRRFAAAYVITLSTAMFAASAFFFDLGGITVSQTEAHKGVVTAAGMTGSAQAQSTVLTANIKGFTITIPMRDTSL